VGYQVFISHASQDRVIANAVCAFLEQRRIRCWIAPRDAVPGVKYAESIIDGISASRVMVLVFSDHANKSDHIPLEIERAVAKGLVIVPFRIEEVVPTKSLEYFIGAVHWLDAITTPVEAHLEDLVRVVEGILAGPTGVKHPAEDAAAPTVHGTHRRIAGRNWLKPALAAAVTLASVGALVYYGRRFLGPIGGRAAQPAAVLPSPAEMDQIKQRWVKSLCNSQKEDSTSAHYLGFVTSIRQGPNSFIDTWTSAQAMKAILMAEPDASERSARFREAFEWMEKQRFQDNPSTSGWRLQPSSHRIATYIGAWVAIAYCQALQNGRVWDKGQEPAAVAAALKLFNQILSWQDRQSGGWSPAARASSASDWSYATALAVWSLAEAKRTPVLCEKLAGRLESATQRGVDWIIRTNRDGKGWEPIPSLQRGDRFRGLDAQVLFVLGRAASTPGLNDFKDDQKFKKAKQDFLVSSQGVTFDEKSTVPPADSAVDGEFYYGECLAYPWTLAVLKQLQEDTSLSPAEREKASHLLAELFRQREAVEEKVESAESYYLAENLIALAYDPRQ